MKDNIIEIKIPKETVSDSNYKIIQLDFKNSDSVKANDIIAELETSKATFEIESPVDGYLYYLYEEGQNIEVNNVFAVISKDVELDESMFESIKRKYSIATVIENISNINYTSQKISKPAQLLIEKYKIDISVFSELSLVSTNDVNEYILSAQGKTSGDLNLLNDLNSSAVNKIVLVGGGKHTMACLDILNLNKIFNIAGVIYTKTIPSVPLYGLESLGNLNDLKKIFETKAKNAVVAFGGLEDMEEREYICNLLISIGFHLPNLIHPKSNVEQSAILGYGNQIFAGANLGSEVIIGNNCIINSNTVISHHCKLDNNVHVTPGAILGGSVTVGRNSIIGMGSTLYYGIDIGANTIVNNGKHIFKNLPANTIIK